MTDPKTETKKIVGGKRNTKQKQTKKNQGEIKHNREEERETGSREGWNTNTLKAEKDTWIPAYNFFGINEKDDEGERMGKTSGRQR